MPFYDKTSFKVEKGDGIEPGFPVPSRVTLAVDPPLWHEPRGVGEVLLLHGGQPVVAQHDAAAGNLVTAAGLQIGLRNSGNLKKNEIL